MRSPRHRTIGAALGAAALAVSAPVALATSAGAQEGPLGPTGSLGGLSNLPEVFNPGDDAVLAVGGSPSGTCWGGVSVNINGEGYPDSAVATWNVGVFGIGDCGLEATLHWTNTDTGESGEKSISIDEPEIFPARNDGKSGIMTTGPGDVEYTLTTNGGATSDTVVVTTVPYEGG